MSFRPPRWMRATGGWTTATDRAAGRRLFHAYDQNDNALCDKGLGLYDGDRPTEADLADLCPECAHRDGSPTTSQVASHGGEFPQRGIGGQGRAGTSPAAHRDGLEDDGKLGS